MSQNYEAVELLEKQAKAFEQFKRANNRRLDAIEAEGFADPLLEEKVDKANAEVTMLAQQLNSLEKVLNRPAASGSGKSYVNEEDRKAFDGYMRKGIYSDYSTKEFSTTGAEGGYAVPEHLDSQLNNYLYDANSMRQIADVVQAESSDYKVAFNTGGLAAGWVGEKDGRPETVTPTISQVTPPTGELYCNPAATQWMIDDAGLDLGSWLLKEVEGKFANMEGDAFINGDGTNKPKGVLAYTAVATDDSTRAFGVLKYFGAASATVITADEFIGLTFDLRGVYRRNAVFLVNSTTAAYVRKLKDSNGQYLWQASLQAGMPPTLLGFRVVIDEGLPNIATGNAPVLFGDFKQGYRIVDRTPLRVIRDELTNKPYVHFYSTKRVSGMLMDSCAIRLLQMA